VECRPYALGAWSAAVPGSQFARRQFLDPITSDVWYAGEAAHETLWGTVGGAWESGERAADAVLRRLGPLKETAPAEAEAKPKHNAKHPRERYEADAAAILGHAQHHARNRCADIPYRNSGIGRGCRISRPALIGNFVSDRPAPARQTGFCGRGDGGGVAELAGRTACFGDCE